MPFAAILAVGALTAAESICEVPRQPQPDGLSGISRIADGRYLVVDDTGGQLFTMLTEINPKTGEINSVCVTNRVVLDGVRDGEGVAWDPLRKTVWVIDERGPRLSEHDAKTGRRLGELKLPQHFSRMRRDLGPEALTISPDGLSMWTSTEESVTGDGMRSTRESGSIVRLQRFARKSAKDNWKADGQFAYQLDAIGGGNFRKLARSGLSGLCAVGGELIALEREFSVKGFLPSFRMRLYAVSLSGATDTSAITKLEGVRFNCSAKRLLLDADTGFSMYEGVSVGPKLNDGTQTLILVADGDGEALETVMSVRLLHNGKAK